MWQLRYPLADDVKTQESKDHLIVATTRPETMLGDSAVAVHPDDSRYKNLIGKFIELPLVGRRIPIIADSYVDQEFGTSCVKITPPHDFNDYEVGKRHQLPMFNILDKSATVLANAEVYNSDGSSNDSLDTTLPEAYAGLDRYDARKAIIADLDSQGIRHAVTESVW